MALIWVAILRANTSADLPVMTKIAAELGRRVAPFRSWSWGHLEDGNEEQVQVCIVGEVNDKAALDQIVEEPSVREARAAGATALTVFEGTLDTSDDFPAVIPTHGDGVTYGGFTEFKPEITQERAEQVRAQIIEFAHALPDIKDGCIGWCNRDMDVPWHLSFTWHLTSKEALQRYFRNPLHGPLYQGVRDTFKPGWHNTSFVSRPTGEGAVGKLATDKGLEPYRYIQIVQLDSRDTRSIARDVQRVLRDPQQCTAKAVTTGVFAPTSILSNASAVSPAQRIALVLDFDNPGMFNGDQMRRVLEMALGKVPTSADTVSVSYRPRYVRLGHVLPIGDGRVRLLDPLPSWEFADHLC